MADAPSPDLPTLPSDGVPSPAPPDIQAETLVAPAAPVRPALDRASAETRAWTAPGAAWHPRVPGYQIERQLGMGGMGVVYLARQEAAGRRVALKLIRADRVQTLPAEVRREMLERFRQEAQVTARLAHENIVTVYEVGEFEGRPFYSLQYVEGPELADLLALGPLTPRQAAAWLAPVARAVHEVHGQGVLHRDIKPHNLLLDQQKDRLLVADFGLAKLRESEQHLTHTGEALGTPSYMPPEQILNTAAATPAADVYALGATLYHMLTGRPPFYAATAAETTRQVLDEEPAPPSRLNPAINRDLETICLKCLEKQPERRYEDARRLAEDLERFLGGQSIQARPVSLWGKVERWRKRNPLKWALLNVAAAFAILFVVALAWGYLSTAAALRESDASLRAAHEAVNDLHTRVSENVLLNEPGLQPVRAELLGRALEYYERLLAEHPRSAALQDDVAAAHFRIGLIRQELESLEAALPSLLEARRRQRELAEGSPADPARWEAWGKTETALGALYVQQRRFDEADQALRQALVCRERLVELARAEEGDLGEPQRQLANAVMNLGLLEKQRGRPDEARRLLERGQAIRREVLAARPSSPATSSSAVAVAMRADLAQGDFNLGNLAWERQDAAAAERSFQAAAASWEGVLREEPQNLLQQSRLARCQRMLGQVRLTGKLPRAEEALQRGLAIADELAAQNPQVEQFRELQAGLCLNLGEAARRGGRHEEAGGWFERACTIYGGITSPRPDWRRDEAVAWRGLGETWQARGDLDLGKQAGETSLALLESLQAEFPAVAEYGEQAQTSRRFLELLAAPPAAEPDPPEVL